MISFLQFNEVQIRKEGRKVPMRGVGQPKAVSDFVKGGTKSGCEVGPHCSLKERSRLKDRDSEGS